MDNSVNTSNLHGHFTHGPSELEHFCMGPKTVLLKNKKHGICLKVALNPREGSPVRRSGRKVLVKRRLVLVADFNRPDKGVGTTDVLVILDSLDKHIPACELPGCLPLGRLL